MTIAYVTADGFITGIFPKPTPFHNIPTGGRMLPVVIPVFDPELQNITLDAPISDTTTEVTYTVTDKPLAEIATIITKRLTNAVQKHLDDTAGLRNYDGIMSAASYATSSHPRFGPEGCTYRDWRDACWDYCYTVMGEVEAGTRPIPSKEALISALPSLTLPT